MTDATEARRPPDGRDGQSAWTWYLLPFFVGVVGGSAAFLLLRRRGDGRTARNCMWLGIIASFPLPYGLLLIAAAIIALASAGDVGAMVGA